MEQYLSLDRVGRRAPLQVGQRRAVGRSTVLRRNSGNRQAILDRAVAVIGDHRFEDLDPGVVHVGTCQPANALEFEAVRLPDPRPRHARRSRGRGCCNDGGAE